MAHPSVLAERLASQLLSTPGPGNVVDVVRRILAVQAQDPRGARLAIRVRSQGLSARDVDAALTADRSVVISTVNRGTLHLMCSEDYWWLHDLTTPQLVAGSTRRLAQEQVSPDAADRGVAIIARTLADGPASRDELRTQIRAARIRTEGQAFAHILFLATLRGLIVRGPMVDGEHAFVLARDWLGKPPPTRDREQALGELAHRYLVGHGPAGDADLARWAGISLGDARRGLVAISDRLVERSDGLAAIRGSRPSTALPAPRLLGAFDPSLLGWSSREPIIGSHQGIVTTNGVFRPFAMVRGRAVTTWSINRGQISMSPFAAISKRDRTALDADGDAVRRYLG